MAMPTTTTNPNRLFWRIALALFVPAIAIAVETGLSRHLLINISLNLSIFWLVASNAGPAGSAQADPIVVAVANISALIAVLHAVYVVIIHRHQVEPAEDIDLETSERAQTEHADAPPPPAYAPGDTTAQSTVKQ